MEPHDQEYRHPAVPDERPLPPEEDLTADGYEHGLDPYVEPERLQAEQEPAAEPPRETTWQKIVEWIKVMVAAVVIGLLITTFVMQRNTVSGESMVPTLLPRDELIVEKVSKWFGGIQRGDIITVHMENPVLTDGEANIIKRVIGMPGDHVQIEDGRVRVNGEWLEEDYLPADVTTDAFGNRHKDVLLGEDEYFVMGDNRSLSLDSRRLGPIDKKNIIGEVLVRIYPFQSFGSP